MAPFITRASDPRECHSSRCESARFRNQMLAIAFFVEKGDFVSAFSAPGDISLRPS